MENVMDEKMIWGKYKVCDDLRIEAVINEYFENKIINNNYIIAIFILLKHISNNVIFITKTNNLFYKCFLKKFGISLSSRYKLIGKEKVINSCKKSVVLNEELKTIVEYLLIIINYGR